MNETYSIEILICTERLGRAECDKTYHDTF